MKSLALFVALIVSAQAALAAGQAPLQKSQLIVESGRKWHRFVVELAQTPEQRSRGLMFRTSVPEGTGMLFDYLQAQPRLSFWMKNTPTSLDIIFLGADARIINIAAHTTPFSEAEVHSSGPARAVLELVAGSAARLGFKSGDRVRHAIFGDIVR